MCIRDSDLLCQNLNVYPTAFDILHGGDFKSATFADDSHRRSDGQAGNQMCIRDRDYKGNVTVKVDGIAASAASVIAMAGTKVLVSPVSMLMIHNPMTVAFGNSAEMPVSYTHLSPWHNW